MANTILDPLTNWNSPFLRKCSFACVGRLRIEATTEPSPQELDLLIGLLPNSTGISGTFFECANLPAVPAAPYEEDFDDNEQYELAYDAFAEHKFDPKPWTLVSDESTLIMTTIRSAMNWDINNKRYVVRTASGEERVVAFSHEEFENEQIITQENEHEKCVERYCRNLSDIISGHSCWLHETDHMLDTLNPPAENAAEAFEGCFYDRGLIVTTDEISVLLWIGRLRYYG